MSLQKDNYYCSRCKKWIDSNNTNVRQIKEIFPVKGENIESKSNVRFCSNCGSELFDDFLDSENLSRAFNEYRRLHGLLTPSEIRKIREIYGVTPQIFSKILGFEDEKSIERLESGSVQSLAQNHLIVLAENPDNFRIMLEQVYIYERLSNSEYEFAQSMAKKAYENYPHYWR